MPTRDRDLLDLSVQRLLQPDDVSCGPTCLAVVLRYHGVAEADIAAVMARTPRNPDGGTLAPHLGLAALSFGLGARVWPFAVRVFDPTWRSLGKAALLAKLRARVAVLTDERLRDVHEAYVRFIEAGGEVRLGELRGADLVAAIDAGHPLITGLSVTWLYQHAREIAETNTPDDVRGMPVGHFVVVSGYESRGASFLIADPWPNHPFSGADRYHVSQRRLLQAILLGDATHDAVVVEIYDPRSEA